MYKCKISKIAGRSVGILKTPVGIFYANASTVQEALLILFSNALLASCK